MFLYNKTTHNCCRIKVIYNIVTTTWIIAYLQLVGMHFLFVWYNTALNTTHVLTLNIMNIFCLAL